VKEHSYFIILPMFCRKASLFRQFLHKLRYKCV
jgi:hypothetical protein